MNNEQILEIAIQKAIDGGWLPYFAEFDKNMHKDNIVIRFSEGAARYAYYLVNDPLPAEVWVAVRYDVFIEEESDG